MRIDALLPEVRATSIESRAEPEDKTLGLGAVIQEVRKRRGITQQQLADAVGLERTSITNIERGAQRLQLSTLKGIADALDMSLTIRLEPRAESPASSALASGETTMAARRARAHLARPDQQEASLSLLQVPQGQDSGAETSEGGTSHE